MGQSKELQKLFHSASNLHPLNQSVPEANLFLRPFLPEFLMEFAMNFLQRFQKTGISNQ